LGQGTQNALQPVPDEISPSSSFARVAGTFASPVQTSRNIIRHPRFAAPFLAIWLLFAGFWAIVYAKWGLPGMAVAVAQFVRHEALVTQDEIDFTLQISRALVPMILIGGTLAILVHLFIVAWIGTRMVGILLGLKLRLRAALSLACYAYLARTIAQTLFSIPVVLFGDLSGLNFGNLVPTNIAFFLDPKGGSRILYAFLQSLDVIQLSYFILLGIGFSADADDQQAPPVLAVCWAALLIGGNVLLAACGELMHAP